MLPLRRAGSCQGSGACGVTASPQAQLCSSRAGGAAARHSVRPPPCTRRRPATSSCRSNPAARSTSGSAGGSSGAAARADLTNHSSSRCCSSSSGSSSSSSSSSSSYSAASADPLNPDLDEIVLDDAYYAEMGMTREQALAQQREVRVRWLRAGWVSVFAAVCPLGCLGACRMPAQRTRRHALPHKLNHALQPPQHTPPPPQHTHTLTRARHADPDDHRPRGGGAPAGRLGRAR
jgi:hypothetical protein